MICICLAVIIAGIVESGQGESQRVDHHLRKLKLRHFEGWFCARFLDTTCLIASDTSMPGLFVLRRLNFTLFIAQCPRCSI
jgi:hypothetical protein